jgi:hypothetical protein
MRNNCRRRQSPAPFLMRNSTVSIDTPPEWSYSHDE